MNNYIFPSDSLFITQLNNQVVEGKIKSVIFSVSKENGINAETYRFSHNGEIYTLPITQTFWLNKENLMSNNPLIPRDKDSFLRKIHPSLWKEDRTLYYYNNGKSELWTVKDNLKYYEVDSDGNLYVLEGFCPDELFEFKEMVFAYNDVVVIKDDGTEDKEEGYLSPLILTEKQQEIFHRFKDILNEMRDENISIVHDYDNSRYYVVNTSVYDISICGCDEGYIFCHPSNQEFGYSNSYLYYEDNADRISLINKK